MENKITVLGENRPTWFTSSILGLVVFLVVFIFGIFGVDGKSWSTALGFGSRPFFSNLLVSSGIGVLAACLIRSVAYLKWWLKHCSELSVSGIVIPLFLFGAFVGSQVILRIESLPVWFRGPASVVCLLIWIFGTILRVSKEWKRAEQAVPPKSDRAGG